MGSDLKLELLRLLREDEEFRLAVAGLLGLGEILEELRRLREDFNAFVRESAKRWEENARRWEENAKRWEENARRWEEADRKFRWLMTALAEIRDSLGGAFEYYTANVVRALLSERGFICGVRVNVTLPVDGFREVDVFCPEPLVVGEATTSLRTIEEAERELAKLLSNVEAAERFTGRKAYLKVLAVETAPADVIEHLRRRAAELNVYLIVGREY